jgi:hypothetical protein
MPGKALVIVASWLAWLGVVPCCSSAFFLAAPVFFLALQLGVGRLVGESSAVAGWHKLAE